MIDDLQFRTYYQACFPQVYGFFLKRGFSQEDALELAQETFLRVYKNRTRFKGSNEASFRSWLKTIVETTWKNKLRAESAFKRDAVTVPLDFVMDQKKMDDPDPLDGMINNQRVARLRKAVEKLPPKMRDCLIFRIHHQLKYSEIAKVMHISLPAVKTLLFKAREQLTEDLGHEPDEET